MNKSLRDLSYHITKALDSSDLQKAVLKLCKR